MATAQTLRHSSFCFPALSENRGAGCRAGAGEACPLRSGREHFSLPKKDVLVLPLRDSFLIGDCPNPASRFFLFFGSFYFSALSENRGAGCRAGAGEACPLRPGQLLYCDCPNPASRFFLFFGSFREPGRRVPALRKRSVRSFSRASASPVYRFRIKNRFAVYSALSLNIGFGLFAVPLWIY